MVLKKGEEEWLEESKLRALVYVVDWALSFCGSEGF